MLALYELPGGYALFQVVKGGGFKLVAQHHFKDSEAAVEAAEALMKSELHSSLKKFLKKCDIQDTLAVQDSKLGNLIKKKLDIPCIFDAQVEEVMRNIRDQVTSLIEGLTDKNMLQMSLGLAHTLNRHLLKFSADKIDVMVIQAIGLLDDLDKELNIYAMRVKEWYGWHFPEMAKVVVDNLQYARVILKVGVRENAATADFTDLLDDDVAAQVRDAAIHSMGVGLTTEDITNIKLLCEEVIATSQYRAQLFEYLRNRMSAIAPNLTAMVGELVGARLISHAGSLMNLAKMPSSTVQILGAEKALFRALKAKEATPKYGLIYHATLVGQAKANHKGKIARITACRAALATRVDALAENVTTATIGVEGRESVEFKLRKLESGQALSGSKQDVNKKGTYGAVVAGEGWAPSEPSTETPFRIKPPKRTADEAEGSAEAEQPKAKKAKAAKPDAEEPEAEAPKTEKKKRKDAE
jgi:nucleolar protein 58